MIEKEKISKGELTRRAHLARAGIHYDSGGTVHLPESKLPMPVMLLVP